MAATSYDASPEEGCSKAPLFCASWAWQLVPSCQHETRETPETRA